MAVDPVDTSAFLSSLAEEYERSCALLSELEKGLSSSRLEDSVSCALDPQREPEPPEEPKPKSTGIKTNIVRFFSRKASTSMRRRTATVQSEAPEVEELRKPSVVNLDSKQLDEFLAADPMPRRSISLQPRRRSLALQPSLTLTRQQIPDLEDLRRAYNSNCGTPTTPRRALQPLPSDRVGLPNIFAPSLMDSQDLASDPILDSPSASEGVNSRSPSFVYTQSSLFAPAPMASRAGLASRENSMRRPSISRRGSEHDSVLSQLLEARGSNGGTYRRPPPLVPQGGSPSSSQVVSPGATAPGTTLPSLGRTASGRFLRPPANTAASRRLTVTNITLPGDDDAISEAASASDSDADGDEDDVVAVLSGDSSKGGTHSGSGSALRPTTAGAAVGGGGGGGGASSFRNRTQEGAAFHRREVAFYEEDTVYMLSEYGNGGGGGGGHGHNSHGSEGCGATVPVRASTTSGYTSMRASLPEGIGGGGVSSGGGVGAGRTPMALRAQTYTNPASGRFISGGHTHVSGAAGSGSLSGMMQPQPPPGPPQFQQQQQGPLPQHQQMMQAMGRQRSKSMYAVHLAPPPQGLRGVPADAVFLPQRMTSERTQ